VSLSGSRKGSNLRLKCARIRLGDQTHSRNEGSTSKGEEGKVGLLRLNKAVYNSTINHSHHSLAYSPEQFLQVNWLSVCFLTRASVFVMGCFLCILWLSVPVQLIVWNGPSENINLYLLTHS